MVYNIIRYGDSEVVIAKRAPAQDIGMIIANDLRRWVTEHFDNEAFGRDIERDMSKNNYGEWSLFPGDKVPEYFIKQCK